MPAVTVPVSINLPPAPAYAFRNTDARGATKCILCHPKNGCSVARAKLGALRRELLFSADCSGRRQMRMGRFVVARSRNGFNGLGGGMNSETARVLGNLSFAILLTYLSLTGQLGWLVDFIVSVWLLAVLIPIVGIVAFLWWAGQDMIRGSCPNCGNGFQVFKSTLNDDLQLCPFCSQPFSVEDNEFVREAVKFSNQSTQTFRKKGKDSSTAVVDVEAEIRDAE